MYHKKIENITWKVNGYGNTYVYNDMGKYETSETFDGFMCANGETIVSLQVNNKGKKELVINEKLIKKLGIKIVK